MGEPLRSVSYEEYMAVTRRQMERDRRRFTEEREPEQRWVRTADGGWQLQPPTAMQQVMAEASER